MLLTHRNWKCLRWQICQLQRFEHYTQHTCIATTHYIPKLVQWVCQEHLFYYVIKKKWELWHSSLIHCPDTHTPYWSARLVYWDFHFNFLILHPGHTADHGSSAWAPDIHMGGTYEIPGSWLWSDPLLDITDTWNMNQNVAVSSFSLYALEQDDNKETFT